jgi:DNA polymerase
MYGDDPHHNAHAQLGKTVDDLVECLTYLKQAENITSVEADPDVVEALGVPPAASPAPPSGSDAPSSLEAIAQRVAACTRCPLHESRRNTVPGQGPSRTELIFIGEGPGANEDEQGLAFVGRAGQLLTRLIEAMGMTRDEVWIGNIVKCRPPGNRTPYPDEMGACMPFLKEQLAILQPKVIVCLGATAVKGLLDTRTGITKLRGTWMSFEGIDVMPTYHPAFLLRGGGEGNKRYWEVWSDMEDVLRRLGRPVPKKEKK